MSAISPFTRKIATTYGLIFVVAFVVVFAVGCSPPSPPKARVSQAPAARPATKTETKAAPAAETDPVAPVAETPARDLGAVLYAQHCAACHGERGDGLGIAAKVLFPKPRDFQAGRFRLVSTSSNVPSREDLQAVLIRGMPGSSMPPWKHLPQVERDALVSEVMRLRTEGARNLYIRILKEDEELTDEQIATPEVQQDIASYVERFTTPGEPTEVPEIGEPTADDLAAAKMIYATSGCLQCHGETGRGDGVQKMVDDEQYPTAPRDFTAGIFKGGHDPASLYRRIAYGMPGTPMPSSQQLTPEQVVQLVHYIRGMSTEEQRERAVLNREQIRVMRVAALSESTSWDDVPAFSLRMAPLWWRDGADPDLSVQAIHDGKTVALRLVWKDAARDEHAIRTEAFEDAAAVALYRGRAEPFIGMGDRRTTIDLWYWDADRQTLADIEDQYPNVVADQYPFSEKVAATAEFQREATTRKQQPPLSLPAEASGNQIAPGNVQSGASALAVGGLGSTTFRIPQNQHVTARGQWLDGKWSVVLTRPLALPAPEDGVMLTPGDAVSAAFAVWDGAHFDRNGRKLITIWQDLQLDK